MKKFISIALISILAFSSCGSKEANNVDDTAVESTESNEETTETTEESEDVDVEDENSNEVSNDEVDYIEDEQSQDYSEEMTAFYDNMTKEVTSLPQLEAPVSGDQIAVIKTNYGDITVKLLSDYAPLAVENFVTHANEGYYDGLIFHRVVENFVIQGGDPTGTGMGGESIWGEPFDDEIDKSVRHFNGALAMANAGPNTNGSQFYIVVNENDVNAEIDMIESLKDEPVMSTPNGDVIVFGDLYPQIALDAYRELGGTPALDLNYTVFGQVIDGFDIVKEISHTEVDGMSKPLEDVVIETIEISTIE